MHWLLSLDYHHWLLTGLLLLAIELVLRHRLLLCAGLAAFLTGLAILLLPLLGWHLGWRLQLLAFSILLAGLLLLDWNDAGFLMPSPGQTLVLATPIEDGQGEVMYRRRRWRVAGPDLAAGTRVRVVGRRGEVLDVEPLA